MSPYRQHCERWKNGCGAPECGRARHVVFARGSVPCDVLFLGEGPGVSEDVLGKPFKGPAGELLQRIIDEAVPPEVSYALYNVVGCMPTDDDGDKSGEPTQDQLYSCLEKLVEFVGICRPKLIVCVGNTAEDWLDEKAHHHAELGHECEKIAVKHPAALLRSTVAVRGFEIQRCIVQVSSKLTSMREKGLL